MVINDYRVVMTRRPMTVRVAELKARLSEYLRAVRRGADVTIQDRSGPIARLVPYAARDARLVRQDAVQILLAERRSGR
jgi:prevent-host-death family protein